MFTRNLAQRTRSLICEPALRNFIGVLVLALSVGYLGYMLVRNWDQLVSYRWRIDYWQTAWAFMCYSLSLALAVLGWGLVMGRLTGVRDLRKHLKYYIYTNLLRRLPAPLLYILGRVYLYEREGIAKSAMVTISLLEWILIILSGMIVYLLTLPFFPLLPNWHSPWVPVGALIAGVLLLHPRIIRAVLRLWGKQEFIVSFGYGDVLVWLVIYSLVWIGGGLMLYASINSLYAISLASLPAVIGAWVLSGVITTLIFVTSAGLGLKELTLSILLSRVIPFPLAIIVALLIRVCLVLFEIIWGIIALKL